MANKPGSAPSGVTSASLSPKVILKRMAPLVSATLRGRAPVLPGGPGFDSLGRIGPLEVRLARTAAEIRNAQALRFRVFYEEMAAVPDDRTRMTRRDADRFDPLCDHLLVVDHDDMQTRRFRRAQPRVVGTYRLLLQETAEANGGFYTAGEFDIAPVLRRHGELRFMELGRSCVLPPYRNKRTMELLWHGIWAYVLSRGVDVMFGCASLEGTDLDRIALPLSFLHHFACPPESWRVEALPGRAVDMNRMPRDAIDTRAALHALPPLIKGYLRLGASVGRGAVVDHQFCTTDVLIVLPVSAISSRYLGYYGPDASRHSA